MHTIQTKSHIGKMRFKVEGKTAYPACKRAKEMCRLTKEEYLEPSQLKMLEIMGFDIGYEKQDGFDPILTRGFI